MLICLEASAEDAARTAWTTTCASSAATTRPIRGRRSRARSTRPSTPRSEYGRVGLELSLGTQASDRMVGEPTTFTKAWFDAFPDAADATPLLARARSMKTEQEVARMRIANEIAAARDGARPRRGSRPGMKESEVAALWQGFVHGEGTARDEVELALPFSLVWAGQGHQDVHRDRRPAGRRGRAGLFEIWVCADGYWADHTKNLVVGELKPEYAELEAALSGCTTARSSCLTRARRWPSSTRSSARTRRAGIRASRPIRSATASARARTSRRTRTRPAAARSRTAWCSPSSPASTGRAAAACASRTTSSSPPTALEKLSAFPDGVVRS